jgi:uncharacterized membrane protein YcaP (DUF421 family)
MMSASSLLVPVEIVGRVTLVYGVLLAVVRLIGRRELKQMTPMDLLAMLLVTRAIGEGAMVGAHRSLVAELFAASALLGVMWLTGKIVFRSRRAETVINGHAEVLIAHGRLDPAVLRRNAITDEDLRLALHKHGLTSVSDVARAWLEANGEITMVSFTELIDATEHRPRRA